MMSLPENAPKNRPATAKLCFVIGPMNENHMPKLRFLAREVLAPILAPVYVVKTPDEFGTGNIMDQSWLNPQLRPKVQGSLRSNGRACSPSFQVRCNARATISSTTSLFAAA